MKREPDKLEVIDDTGGYDMREMRQGVVYVERPKRREWLVTIASVLLAGGVAAAWTANARLAALEATVSDLKEQITELKQLVQPRYRGVPDAHTAR